MNALPKHDLNPLNILDQEKYNVSQAAKKLGMSNTSLNRLCKRGDGPNEISIAGKRRFLEKELERWLVDQNPQLQEQFLVMESARRAMEKMKLKKAKLKAVS